MTWPRGFAILAGVLASVMLSAAAAAPQDLATAEQEAFAALSRAVASLERAADRSASIRAAEQLAAAGDRARDAFAAADDARRAAADGYGGAYRAALAAAVTCANGYPCTGGRLDPFEGIAGALVTHLHLLASVSFAAAVHVEAVGVAGAHATRCRSTGRRESSGCRSQASGGGARFSMCEVSIRTSCLTSRMSCFTSSMFFVMPACASRFSERTSSMRRCVPFTSALHHAGERNAHRCCRARGTDGNWTRVDRKMLWSPAASSSQQRARVLTDVKARRFAPPPLRAADGLDVGSAHARPDWLLPTMPTHTPLHVVVAVLSRMTPFPATVDTVITVFPVGPLSSIWL